MRRVGLLWLLALGCATPISEHYRVEGSAPEMLETARATAGRLGWTTEAAEGGGFRITDFPRKRPGETMLVTASEGELKIDGDGNRAGSFQSTGYRLSETAEVLARATDVQLHDRSGPPVAPRSRAVTVALDLLLPAAGGWYAGRGDPYLDSAAVPSVRSFWWDFMLRCEFDLMAAAFAGVAVYNHHQGWVTTPFDWLLPIAFAVANRALSIVRDWPEVGFRNAYAASGLPAPGEGPSSPVRYVSVR
jgi:hypothetical protein